MDRVDREVQRTGIKLDRVAVDYPIYGSNSQVLQRRILNIASFGKINIHLGETRTVHALKDVSFELNPGCSVGLIGKNGAGKSTLLKLMAGVVEPTSGTVTRSGTITSLLTIGSGMEPELDGHQNIRRVGLLRGFTPTEIESMAEEIVDFAQIGEFISLPVRTYSAGMRMRLAFAIATVGTPDILLVDEVFGAGDSAFMKRARDRISALLGRSKSIVFSSHSSVLVREFCTTCLYLERGQIRAHDNTEDVLKLYAEDVDKTKTTGRARSHIRK